MLQRMVPPKDLDGESFAIGRRLGLPVSPRATGRTSHDLPCYQRKLERKSTNTGVEGLALELGRLRYFNQGGVLEYWADCCPPDVIPTVVTRAWLPRADQWALTDASSPDTLLLPGREVNTRKCV